MEQRILPLAREQGIAVLINRPFRQGALTARWSAHPLPPCAAEIGAATWAQFLLKFIVSHPAVTCVIPATSEARARGGEHRGRHRPAARRRHATTHRAHVERL